MLDLEQQWRLRDMDYPSGGKLIPKENVYLPPVQMELNGLSRQEALDAIIDILSVCQQRLRLVNLPRVLEDIQKYLSKSLEPNRSGKLELVVGQHDWQVWTRYKKALSDFQAGLMKEWRTHLIEEYESINGVMLTRPYLACDRDFFQIANRIQSLTSRPPVGVDAQYWYSIAPHAFNVKESLRAIDKINRLHQEWQWATHGEGGNALKGLWLFVWRVLKKTWLVYNQEGQSFPVAVAAAVSLLEKPLLDKYTNSFILMDRTSEVLHHDQAELMVAEYAFSCYNASSAWQKQHFNKSRKLDADAKRSMHEFIHGKTAFTAKVAEALRTTAARYYIQRLKQDRWDDQLDIDNLEEDDSADEAPSSPVPPNTFPVPLALARKSPYDYVWYDMPDTRAREVAESCRIERDMTEPGIQSDGLRTSELVNIPPRHARRPGQVSRWKTFAPVFGPVSFPWRLARYWFKGGKRARPVIHRPPRLARRDLTRPSRDAAQGAPPTPLSPVRGTASRITKPKSAAQLPKVKLRGGGPKVAAPDPAWEHSWSKEQAQLVKELANEIGVSQPTTDQANFLVGSYLTANQWNVETAARVWRDNPVPIDDMRYDVLEVGLLSDPLFTALSESQHRELRLLLAALGAEKVSQLENKDILAALEDQDWRWEAALVDIRGDIYPEDSYFVSTFVASEPRARGSGSDNGPRSSRGTRSHSSRFAEDDNDKQGHPASAGSKSSGNVSRKSGEYEQSGNRAAQLSSAGVPALSQSKPPKPMPQPITTPTRRLPNNDPKRDIHEGAHGYPTDSRSSDDIPDQMIQVAPEAYVSPSQAASARRRETLRRREQQAQPQHDEGADGGFDIYDEDLPLSAQSGLADRIDEFDAEPERRPSASDSPFDEENTHRPPMQAEARGPCHPCPQYDGQYHHLCFSDYILGSDGRTCGSRPHDASPETQEPEDLPYELGSSPQARHDMLLRMDADIHAVAKRQDKDQEGMLNEVQIHARLQRILQVAAMWPSGDDYNPLPVGQSAWKQFLLPQSIEEQGPMSYEAWRKHQHAWQAALAGPARRAALRAIRDFIVSLVDRHYKRNSPARCVGASKDVIRVETFQSFPYYHKVARSLQRNFTRLADLFAEVNGFADREHVRSTHAEHHDSFRAAYCDLLSLRRALGQVVPDAECDQAPQWVDYRAHGLGPRPELHEVVKAAIKSCSPIIEFFRTRDTDTDFALSLEFLEDAMTALRSILYGSPDQSTPPRRGSYPEQPGHLQASQRKPASGAPTSQGRKRKSNEANADADAQSGGAKKPRQTTPQLAASSRGGSSSGKSARASDKENAAPKNKTKNMPRQPLAILEDNDEVDEEQMVEVVDDEEDQDEEEDVIETPTQPKSRAAAKVQKKPTAPSKAKATQQLPTADDYDKWLYADEISDEIQHRGITVKGKANKANNIKALVAADKQGNTGFGVMAGWRKYNGMNQTDKRPSASIKPSAAEVRKKFKGRLV